MKCIFCINEHTLTIRLFKSGLKFWHVYCDDCGASGPLEKSLKSANKKWQLHLTSSLSGRANNTLCSHEWYKTAGGRHCVKCDTHDPPAA